MVMFVETRWDGEIRLSEELVNELKGKKVALFSSVQFLNLDKVKEQLDNVIISKPKRVNYDCQVLGCDCSEDDFSDEVKSADVILYVGDGKFHYTAIQFALDKPLYVFNPISNNYRLQDREYIDKINKKRTVKLMKFYDSEIIGILVTTKFGQENLDAAKKFKEKLIEKGKQAYIFISDTLDFSYMEDFNFIQSWVNTACPRIGLDDELPVVNMRDIIID